MSGTRCLLLLARMLFQTIWWIYHGRQLCQTHSSEDDKKEALYISYISSVFLSHQRDLEIPTSSKNPSSLDWRSALSSDKNDDELQ